MARITVEDCLQKVNNRFALIHLSAKRVRQLRRGAEPLVQSKNKDIVVSLREIAAGKVRKAEPEDLERLLEEAERRIPPLLSPRKRPLPKRRNGLMLTGKAWEIGDPPRQGWGLRRRFAPLKKLRIIWRT
ncbi:MAG: DNA-directed RNA polymerase subunit omega [Deltaproteobacteria bacterium]|nr:DNA-directed RNA polymerase subunit omega [Deltaproteobacteria bacterium]MBW2007822.1 DNA-directed RNA polymerase subunit omega [Deltaproteobacteria bacterium]